MAENILLHHSLLTMKFVRLIEKIYASIDGTGPCPCFQGYDPSPARLFLVLDP